MGVGVAERMRMESDVGGGSTVMARHMNDSGRFLVVNKPSDGRQRPATQAFAVLEVEP